MAFSVLISVYYKDKAEFFRAALASVIEQTVVPNEIVVVEDGPLSDDLEQVIKEYELWIGKDYPDCALKIIRQPENQGLGKALNVGLKHCSYDLIARMDADDISKPDRFEKQLKVYEEHSEYGLVSSWIDEFEHVPGDSHSVRKVPEMPKENLRYAKSRCPINHPAVMFRKEQVLAVGGYQTTLFPEDYFLWIKMLQNGSQIYNIQESLLWFRYSPETFKRRGGWKYACDEVITQWNIYRLGFIGIPTLCKNVGIRFTTRIMPNRIRGWFYKNMLRKI